METKTTYNLAQLHGFCPFFMNQIGQPRVQVWVKGKKAKACLRILQPMVDNPGRNLHIEIIRSSMKSKTLQYIGAGSLVSESAGACSGSGKSRLFTAHQTHFGEHVPELPQSRQHQR